MGGGCRPTAALRRPGSRQVPGRTRLPAGQRLCARPSGHSCSRRTRRTEGSAADVNDLVTGLCGPSRLPLAICWCRDLPVPAGPGAAGSVTADVVAVGAWCLPRAANP